jgi:dGTPase
LIPGPALAPYAADDRNSRGRRYAEAPSRYRREFQRDRDRILHCSAFRRLVYKTQVFVNHEGDLYRTRLTHSLEVAQIARTVARALALNEDLVEAVSLAHDLGHTPFGHAGQDALNRCMRDYGGFEHNLQSLRVVDELEARYASFPGLNLCFETREGILKHCALSKARSLGDVGQRFIDRKQPGLEAQLANLADEIAYNNHDVDDGLRSGLITLEQLEAVGFFREHLDATRSAYPVLGGRTLVYEVVRRMIGTLVTDLIESSRERIEAVAPASIDAIRECSEPLIGFSTACLSGHRELKRFLNAALYRHPKVLEMTAQAEHVVTALFDAYMQDPERMPAEHAARARLAAERGGAQGTARTIADYVAGMTDRFAMQAYEALGGSRSL